MADKRSLPNWLTAYGKYTEGTESPASFHLYSALHVLAGALQRKVWLPAGHFNIFPNEYICLVSPPGKARKTTAIRVATKMLNAIGVPLVADSITREALIRQAANSEQIVDLPDGRLYHHNSLSLQSDEFVMFTGQNNFAMINLLTDWFDCASVWRYETKNSGVDEIKGLFFNLLGAATPDGLGENLPPASIGGGFTSRIIFVVERDKGKLVAFPKLTAEQERIGEALAKDLEYIRDHFVGPLTLTPEGEKFYEQWYLDESRNKGIADFRLVPYLERKPLHVLKLAILIHVAHKDNMLIDEEDIEIAISFLDTIEPKMPEAFDSVGKNVNASMQSKVLHYIAGFDKGVSEEDLINVFWRDISLEDLRTVLETLKQMGEVKVLMRGSSAMYRSTRRKDQ